MGTPSGRFIRLAHRTSALCYESRPSGRKTEGASWSSARRAGFRSTGRKPCGTNTLFLRWRRGRRTGAAEVVHVRGAVRTRDREPIARGADGEVAAVRGDVERVDVVHVVALPEPDAALPRAAGRDHRARRV